VCVFAHLCVHIRVYECLQLLRAFACAVQILLYPGKVCIHSHVPESILVMSVRGRGSEASSLEAQSLESAVASKFLRMKLIILLLELLGFELPNRPRKIVPQKVRPRFSTLSE